MAKRTNNSYQRHREYPNSTFHIHWNQELIFFSYSRSTLRAAVSRSLGTTDKVQRVVIPFFSLLVKDLYFVNEGWSKNAASKSKGGHEDGKSKNPGVSWYINNLYCNRHLTDIFFSQKNTSVKDFYYYQAVRATCHCVNTFQWSIPARKWSSQL